MTTATAPETERPRTTEIWLYAGIRVNRKGEQSEAWLPLPLPEGENASTRPTDHELWYEPYKGKDAPRPVVGSLYEMSVSRYEEDGKRHIVRYGYPQYHGRCDDAELRATVEAVHRAHQNRHRLAVMERNDKRTSALDEALEPLLAVAKNVPVPDRGALMEYISRKIYAQW